MENIKKILLDNRPNITQQTIKTYISIIKNIGKNIGENIENADDINKN